MNPIINECHWEITKNCNLACSHCISWVGNKRALSTQRALRVIDKLSNLGCKKLYLTGGEPLFRKDIFQILRRAKDKKFKIGLLTNGTLISNKNIKEIKSSVEEIGISIDGSSSQINDQIRGVGSFSQIIKAIKLIKNNQIPLTLYITITKINLSDFGNILRLAKRLGVDSLRINEVTVRGRAWENRSRLVLNPSDRANLREYLIERLKEAFNLETKDFTTDNCCNLKSTTAFLSPTGYLYPCIEIFQRKPSLHLGNIFNFGLKEYLKHRNLLSKFRKSECPYQITEGFGFTLCLDSSSVNCPVLAELHLAKSQGKI